MKAKNIKVTLLSLCLLLIHCASLLAATKTVDHPTATTNSSTAIFINVPDTSSIAKDSVPPNQLTIHSEPLTIINEQLSINNDQSLIPNDKPLITNNQFPISRTFPELDKLIAANATPISTASALLPEGLIPSSDPIDSAQYYIAKAQAVISEIREMKKFVGYLDGESLLSLPVGIHKTIGNLDYDIGIASIKLKPQYAELEVYMQFTVPQNNRVLTFMGKGIKFSKEGGIVGDATLALVADYAINLQGDRSQIILKSGTEVSFDCNGFLEMALNADVKFSRAIIVPESPEGDTLSGNVTGSFRSTIRNWNDLVVEVSLPPFQLTNLKGVGFTANTAVFDFSDLQNALSMRFPAGYQSPALLAGLPNLWRGFYLRELTVSLPPQFNKKDQIERTQFYAQDVLIDELGFSGLLKGTDLFTKESGDMNGWAYSLDSLGMDIMANSLRSGGFKGSLVIPISGEATPFSYSAIIQPGDQYVFNVSAPDSLEFPMFKTSKLEIYANSYVEVKVVDKKFLPKAVLHGNMNIQAKLGKGDKGVELADIAFENLMVQSVAPYIEVGTFSFGSEATQQAMANFPVSINNIGLRNISDTEVGLDFDLLLNLTGADGGSFAADAGLTIIGELPLEATIKEWKYKTVEVRDIGVDIDGGAFKIKGQLKFYKDDATYGEGFNGTVEAEFNMGKTESKPSFKIAATAIFGNVDGFRYWYADALGSFTPGIPIFPGVGIYGFGGGAYYRMGMDTQGAGSDLGKTVSGIVYIPKKNAGLGLKATVELASHPKPEAFTGDVTFEVAFYQGGGIRYISFKGNGYLATPPMGNTLAKLQEKTTKLAGAVAKIEKAMGSSAAGAYLAENAEADQTVTQIYGQIGEAAGAKGQISASVFISYDFENKELHGNFEAYMNVAGGIIKGSGAGGRAGWAVLHFSPDDWYVYVGTPEDRIGLSMGIGPIRAEATSYFMVGTKIPGSPAPPEKVASILKADDLDYMRDLNALGEGAGFAFGSAFSVDTGDLTFLMFYASLSAGAGFDIMLKDYGTATCNGSTDPLGINGWYANGQAYAYFDGKVGIKVKLFGKNKNVDILNLQAAALMQAKLPNPFWMRGIVGGEFSVLGGLVKGNCKFEVTLGEECDITGGSAVEGLMVIAEVTPRQGEKDVNVFNNPQAVFNMPVNEVFEIIDVDEQKKSFRIKLDQFDLMNGTAKIAGELEWNSNNDVVAFDSYDILPSEEELKVLVQVSFEEMINGSWNDVIVDGKKYVEKKELTFTSGVSPDHIPLHNVEYSYPVVNMLNFYKDEYGQGYIKLDDGMPDLFVVDKTIWRQTGRFTASTGEESEFDFTYNDANREVSFNLPTDLSTDKRYQLELLNVPLKTGGEVDRNVTASTAEIQNDAGGTGTEITTKVAEGTIDELQEKQVFGMNFRSSKYGIFSEKIEQQNIRKALVGVVIQWFAEDLTAYSSSVENYDEAELEGNQYTNQQPLVSIEADITNNPYFDDRIIPLVYEDYPISGSTITHRNVLILGLVPTKAMSIYQVRRNKKLLGDDPEGNYFSSSETWGYNFDMHLPMAYDFFEIQKKVVDKFINQNSYTDRIARIIAGRFPLINQGDYKIKLNYQLPGKSQIHSSEVITMKYKLSR